MKNYRESPPIEGIGRDQYAAAMRQQKEEWAEAVFSLPAYETTTPTHSEHIRRMLTRTTA